MRTTNNPDGAIYGVKRIDMDTKLPHSAGRRGQTAPASNDSALEALSVTINALKRAGCYNTAACLQETVERTASARARR